MRDYGTVSPKFWVGKTGKAMRGNAEAQLVALYLMTSPHSTSIGIFHCPLVYITHETGLPFEGASKGLRSLVEAGFCQYDEETEEVFVSTMAQYQVGEALEPKDKRCVWVQRELEKVGSALLRAAFHAIYSVAYCLPALHVDNLLKTSPFEAPSKPLRSQEQEQEQEQEREQDISRESSPGSTASPAAQPPPGSVDQKRKPETAGCRLPEDWVLSVSGRAFCQSQRPDLDPDAVAAVFADHCRARVGRAGMSADWEAEWRNWVRKEHRSAPAIQGGYGANVAGVTVPGRAGLDPALQKLDADAKRAAPIPTAVRDQLASLKTTGA